MNKLPFQIMFAYDVALLVDAGEWDNHYTANRAQHSDNGQYIRFVDNVAHDNAIESFATHHEQLEWCYANGWSVVDDSVDNADSNYLSSR